MAYLRSGIDGGRQGSSLVRNRVMDIRGDLATGGRLVLSTTEPTVVDGNELGRIDFQAPLDTAGTDAILVAASIVAEADGTFSSSVNATELVFMTGASETAAEKMRITSDGKMLLPTGGDVVIGHSAGIQTNMGTHDLQVLGTNSADCGMLIAQFSDSAGTRPTLAFLRSNQDTIGNTLIADGNVLGEIQFLYADGVDYTSIAAKIRVLGSTGSSSYAENVASADMVFYTSLDTSSPDERMRIHNDGKVGIGTTAPEGLLHIESTVANAATLRIGHRVAQAINTGPDIEFWNAVQDGGTGAYESGAIRLRKENGSTNNHDHYMAFYTRRNSPEAINEVMRIDSDGRVGLGTTAPSTPIDILVDGNANPIIHAKSSGTCKMKVVTTASGGTSGAVGYFMENADDDQWFIGIQDAVGGLWFIDNSSGQSGRRPLCIKKAGGVGIGTTNPGVALDVYEGGTSTVMRIQNGAAEGEVCLLIMGTDGVNNAQITGAGAATFSSHSSDERKKLILGDMPDCLSNLNALPLKKFKWRKNYDADETEAGRDEEHWGVIAQELEKIIPELVYEDDYGWKSLDPLSLTGLCIKAIQELSAKVTVLENA